MRICSLLPSATEILFALGLGDSVVGVTHECDFPPEAAGKPALIWSRVDPTASPSVIDEQVRALVARGESVYGVRDDLLREIEPDLIVTQELCHVCAASPDDLATALSKLASQPRVLSLTPHTLADVWGDIRRVGAATGKVVEADTLATRLARRVAAIRFATEKAGSRPRVACIEWLDPFYVAGHWVPEMIACAGGEDIFGRAGQPSFRIASEEVVAAQPEVVVIMPCGHSIARAVEDYRTARMPVGWSDIPAVRDNRVFAVDANSYFSRPSPRLADGVALLARIFHPELKLDKVSAGSCEVLVTAA